LLLLSLSLNSLPVFFLHLEKIL